MVAFWISIQHIKTKNAKTFQKLTQTQSTTDNNLRILQPTFLLLVLLMLLLQIPIPKSQLSQPVHNNRLLRKIIQLLTFKALPFCPKTTTTSSPKILNQKLPAFLRSSLHKDSSNCTILSNNIHINQSTLPSEKSLRN